MAFFAKEQLIAAAGALAFCLLSCVAEAASCGKSAAGFQQWKVEFAETAKAAGVRGRVLQRFSERKYAVGDHPGRPLRQHGFQRLGRRPHEKTWWVRDYFQGPIAQDGERSTLRQHRAYVRRARRGVARHLGYGDRLWRLHGQPRTLCRQSSRSPTIAAASQFFASHAIAALKLVDNGVLSARSVGAMHGEIGQTGFLPGNVLKYGVGSRNMRDTSTALMSTANFLGAHGWRAGGGYQRQYGRHRWLELRECLLAGNRPHRRGDRRQLDS